MAVQPIPSEQLRAILAQPQLHSLHARRFLAVHEAERIAAMKAKDRAVDVVLAVCLTLGGVLLAVIL